MTQRQTPISVIGMACRFPGADTPGAFADMLEAGHSAVRDIPADRWDVAAIYDATPGTAGRSYARHAGLIDTVDRFDAAAFGIAPKEAVAMDPQQRLLLEIASEAFADAGLPRHRLAGARVGVFVGVSTLDYIRLQPSGVAGVDAYSGSGNAMSIAANRISYCFGLEGPSLAVDTACSSSLVAVDLAVQALARGDIDTALVAGANLILAPELMVAFSAARMLAPDGRCKTFDASADGYVRGEGAGAVVLRRTDDAIADADRIYAQILGTAVNQDGRSNGLTAPNGPRQTAVVQTALARAGSTPDKLAYVEAHGTGTPLGDPIEILALADVLGANAGKRCAVGSVKTNIGHLEAAAGIAGLIKTTLALHRGVIPPSLNFDAPNPDIPFDVLPIDVTCVATNWPDDRDAVAGVSSFGFGGTNAHVIMGQRPLGTPEDADEAAPWPLLISGNTPARVRHRAAELADRLNAAPQDLPAMSVTLMVRTTLGDFRAALVAKDVDEAIATLRALSHAEVDQVDPSEASARILSSPDAPVIVERLRKRSRKPMISLPSAGSLPDGWPANWLLPAAFVKGLGCTAQVGESNPDAEAIVGSLLEHALRGRDMAWHAALPKIEPQPLPHDPWDRRLAWFDMAKAPSVRGAATRWLAGLAGVTVTDDRIELNGPLPQDLQPHHGMVPFPLGLALMTAVALRANGPVRLSAIRILQPLRHTGDMVLTADVSGSMVKVTMAEGSVWMDAEITALPDWPVTTDAHTQTGPELTASGPAAAMSALLLKAAEGQPGQAGVPTSAQAFMPSDPGTGPWHLSGEAEAIALNSATGTSVLSGLETAQPLIDLIRPDWVDIGWYPGPKLATAVTQAFASVPKAEPTPDALAQGMNAAAADFAQRALRAAEDADMTHPALPRLRELAAVAEPTETAETITDRLSRSFPEHRDEIGLFARCGAGWTQLLGGQTGNGLQYLLDPNDPEQLLRVYRDGPASRVPNALVAAAVKALIETHGPTRPIRVLEIGAGTGATTARLLPLLPQGSTYVATDLASGLLRAVAHRHADDPALQTRLLDATRPFADQGVAPGSVDLVVAANILHALDAPQDALQEIRAALAPGGQFVLQELTHRAPWLDLVFGLTDGWWAAERSDGALMDQDHWVQLLNTCGLDTITTAHPDPLTLPGAQAVIMAQVAHTVAVRAHTGGAMTNTAFSPEDDTAILAIPDTAEDLAWARTRAVELRAKATPILLTSPDARDIPGYLPQGLEPQLRLSGDRILGFRLSPFQLRTACPHDAAVLILGGTGGLGQIVTRHLAAQGITRIVVAGRSVTSNDPALVAARAAATLDAQQIEAAQIDLLKPKQAANRLAKLLDSGITHIVHAAGTDLSGQEPQDTVGRHGKVQTAKVDGTCAVLDALSDYRDVHLVLVSSAAATLGLPGAAAYAIDNAKAEALINEARDQGQPASFVAFGPVKDAGMATTADAAQWHRFGIDMLDPDLVAQAVTTALHDAAAFQPCLMENMDWDVARQFVAYGTDGRHLAPIFERRAKPVVPAHVVQPDAVATEQTQPVDVAPRVQHLAALPVAAQQSAAQALVADNVAAVLGMTGGGAVPREVGLNDIGLDSLTAVDLASRLSREMGLQLPPTLAFDYPTVTLMASHVLTLLGSAEPAKTGRPLASVARRPSEPLADVDDDALLRMSDADVWQQLVTEGA